MMCKTSYKLFEMKDTKVISNLLWIIKTIYKYEKKYVFISIVNAIINGVLPIISLLTMQRIINLIQLPDSILENIISYISIYVVIEILKIFSSNFYGWYNTRITLDFSLFFSRKILSKVSRLKLKDYENSETYDVINRAKNQGGDKLLQYYSTFIAIISDIITLASYLIIIFRFNKDFDSYI